MLPIDQPRDDRGGSLFLRTLGLLRSIPVLHHPTDGDQVTMFDLHLNDQNPTAHAGFASRTAQAVIQNQRLSFPPGVLVVLRAR